MINVDKLDILKTIRQVEPPADLYPRIRQPIELKDQPWNWSAVAAAIALIISLNGIAIYKYNTALSKTSNLRSVAHMMHLTTNKDIHYE